jgi:hypothetical protein
MSIIERGTNSYYEVSGERAEVEWDEKKGAVLTGIVLPKRVRFQSISQSLAEEFATRVYKLEDIVCEIHEVSRLES